MFSKTANPNVLYNAIAETLEANPPVKASKTVL